MLWTEIPTLLFFYTIEVKFGTGINFRALIINLDQELKFVDKLMKPGSFCDTTSILSQSPYSDSIVMATLRNFATEIVSNDAL